MPIVIPKNELNEFSLPRVCVTTGQPGPVTFQKVQFQYIPKWIAVFALAPIIYLVFFFILRKTATGTMPFSEAGWAQVKAARRNVLISVVGFIVLLVVAGVVSGSSGGDAGPVLFLAALVGGLVAIIVTSLRIRKVFPVATLIDKENVTLTLPSKDAERHFTQHLTSGRQPA